jgi:hypothetical protein
MDEHPGSAWQRTELGSSRLTRFEVRRSFLDNYDVHQVGGQTIPGYWIPAEDLPALNASIVGEIELTISVSFLVAPAASGRRGLPVTH